MAYRISPEQQSFFDEKGYLILRDVMPMEEAMGSRSPRSSPDLRNTLDAFNGLLRGSKMLNILGQLAMLLFKEKINYKFAGSGGFSPHIDSTAYTHVKNIKHLTILMAVDASNMSNGGLEVVEGSHRMEVPIDRSDNCIEKSWVEKQRWVPAELEAGQLLIFGSYLAHRSGANNSNSDRKAFYATYNGKREGDLHDADYEDRAKLWPPTHKRRAGQTYEEGALRYVFGSPMLSVDLGKQFVV